MWKSLLRAFLPEFLRLVVPEALDHYQVERATFLDQEALSDLPRGVLSKLDLVAEVPARVGAASLVLIHIEIERQYRSSMSERMLRYYRHLSLKHSRPVLPIVLFLRGGPPGLKRRQVSESLLGFEVVRFTYWAFGLSKAEAESYLGTNALTPALAACMRSERWRPAEQKLHCLQTILELEVDEARKLLLVDAVETYLSLEKEEALDYAELVARSSRGQEVTEMELTWAGKLEKKFVQQGRTEGRVSGFRQMLETLLEERFGSLTERARKRLEGIEELERLESLGKQALTADSLADLGLD